MTTFESLSRIPPVIGSPPEPPCMPGFAISPGPVCNPVPVVPIDPAPPITSPIPEPGTYALMALGMLAVVAWRRVLVAAAGAVDRFDDRPEGRE